MDDASVIWYSEDKKTKEDFKDSITALTKEAPFNLAR